jgi:radical SAM protein with 4Fe4S-binding SPASM domain
VRPVEAAVKRHWHQRAVGDVARLVSRWRFTVEVTRDGRGAIDLERPAPESLPVRVHVPLSRLVDYRRRPASEEPGKTAPPGAAWVVADGGDVDALLRWLRALAEPELTVEVPLPSLFVDLCRFGARPCVAPRGQAAGAIVDVGGDVRPCIHGEPLGRATDSFATLRSEMQVAAARAFARRGCRECSALAVCSRCLFPAPFADESAYCDFVRAHASGLADWRRLVETLTRLHRRGVEPPLRVRRWPRFDRPLPLQTDELPALVAAAWHRAQAWLVEHADRHHLFWLSDGTLHDVELESLAATVGAALADGDPPPLPARVIERVARRLAALLFTS